MAPFFLVADLLTRLVEPAARRLLALLPARRGARRRSPTFCSASRFCGGCSGGSSATAWSSRRSICITWGTNLFHYAVFDGTFSHAYAFFLVCVLVWLVERWWERPTLALLAGDRRRRRAQRARPAHQRDLSCWCCRSTASSTGATCARASSSCAIGGACSRSPRPRALVVLAPQLALYKWITGRVVRQRVCHRSGWGSRSGRRTWRRALQHAEGAVLLVAGPAAERRRASSSRPAGRGRWLLPAVVIFALQTWLIASWARVAVRRELRTSRIHRRLRARRAVCGVGLRLGGAPPESACRWSPSARRRPSCCRSRR